MKIAIIKLGTDSIVNHNGNLNYKVIDEVLNSINILRSKGISPLLVCSGAVAIGKKQNLSLKLSLQNEARIYASIGQPILLSKLQSRFRKKSIPLAQILLTSKDFGDNERKSILIHTIYDMLNSGILPVINENDLLSNEELDCVPLFNDNDSLAVNVAILVSAKWLFLVSAGIDGLYKDYSNLELGFYDIVTDIESVSISISESKSSSGRGGMYAKIKAIQLAVENNITTYLINGYKAWNIQLALEKSVEFNGTKFE